MRVALNLRRFRRFIESRANDRRISPLIFLKTSSNTPGLRDRSVVAFIHRVFGNAGEDGGCSAGFDEIFGSISGASPEMFAIVELGERENSR